VEIFFLTPKLVEGEDLVTVERGVNIVLDINEEDL
jgi:hypothetical protein